MKEIACWFDFASNYSYLSVLRLARQTEVAVNWKPFLLGPIFKEQGWDNSPFVLQKDKGAYVWQDMPRECAKYGLPWRQPSEFPRRSLLAARVALLGEHQPWMAEFCARVMLANFEHDEDIGSEECIGAILTSIGLDAPALLGQRLPLAALHEASVTAPLRLLEAHPDLGPKAGWMDLARGLAVARIGQRVRVTGGLTVTAARGRHAPDFEALHRGLQHWFPGSVLHQQVQQGQSRRAVAADGLPVLGASPTAGVWLNLFPGAGWGLACGAAQVLAQQIAGQPAALDIAALGPQRLA